MNFVSIQNVKKNNNSLMSECEESRKEGRVSWRVGGGQDRRRSQTHHKTQGWGSA